MSDEFAPTAPLIIMGAPYVFARQKLAKPFHIERIERVMLPVRCHNACGVYYVTEARGPRDVCPDCHAPPTPRTIGVAELVEIEVKVAFGNVPSADFRRSLGPAAAHQQISRVPMILDQPSAATTAHVSSSQE
jgi:hypothetical protein